MKNVVSWKPLILGASILLYGTDTAFATETDHLYPTPSTGFTSAQQDGRQVSCLIVDKSGPIVGANVVVKGTTIGNISDMDGRAIIENVPANAILVVSYIGYISQEVILKGNQTNIKITLAEDSQALDEIVVTGYSTQAKKDITGSVAVVATDALKETPVSNFSEALQGKAAGVFVQAGGGPLGETTIRIRGVGSVNGSDPLIIVDGISGVDIDAVNPNDIETMQILKDAAASAIYGAKGANGVIIITTKQGKRDDRVKVSYNGYFGVAKMANDGYNLLNAWEAMEFQEEGQRNLLTYRGKLANHAQFGSIGADGTGHLTMPYAIKPSGLSKDQVISQFGSIEAWEKSYKDDGTNSWSRSAYHQMLLDGYSEEEARAGTNWYDEVVQTGKVQDHQISISGGGQKATYSVGLGYMNREGTIKESWFRRYSLRANTNFFVNKWFNIGQNTNIAVIENSGERGRQGDDNTFGKTFSIQPWVPIYNIGGDFAGSTAPEGGRAETAVSSVEQGKDNRRRFLRAQSAIYAEVIPIEGLRIKTQFATRLNGSWDYWMNKRTIMTNKEGRNNNEFYEQAGYWLGYQWTNTATYNKTINDDHTVGVVLGTEAIRDGLGRWIQAGRIDYPFEDDPNTWIINNGSSANLRNSGKMYDTNTMFGMFGRIDYSYQGKYLATITVRRDASSKFSEKNRWGTFPSISLGWRMSDEKFMEKTRTWLDDFKLRVGYGTTGNSNIDAYNYAFQYGTGNTYLYSITGSDTDVYTGFGVTNLGDVEAKWETSKMFNIGFDATVFDQRLNINFDYYIKKTSDMLIDANWSALAGNMTKPKVNIGDMENRGVDVNLSWRDKVGEFDYSVGLNLSHYKNKLTEIGTEAGIFEGTRISNMNVLMKGYAVGMFHGYQLYGIYKSEDEVRNYKNDAGGTVLPYGASDASSLNASEFVGQFKVKDVNNDGKIDADDRTFIGNPHPDLTGGLNLSLGWRGFDLSTYLYFTIGNDIFALYKYYTHYGSLQSAYSKDRRDNSWNPVTNPDGIYPMWATSTGESTIAANESNSGYIEDGSFLRMQTLTLGYTLPKKILEKIKFEKIRVYGQISNVFTLTGYSGLDPQVRTDDGNGAGASKDRNMGTDYGSYGMPRQFILGVNVTF
ncbi:TonB-dependent receptor [uncultured Parabacteroides sp.]|uniref:SusC/RagA family TonB-linked outer membrane protein n=1 Tax=uncultured Parabacteroides sp. TaxID=512312 RepID=UPI00262A8417|nr:TonB-dependent receptor [uncultured Parabacteroides sp.]